MASRRYLKKEIHSITCELYARTLCTLLFAGNDKSKMIEVVTKIIRLQDECIRRANHPEPGKVKLYFKKLRSDFDLQVDGIIADITPQKA